MTCFRIYTRCHCYSCICVVCSSPIYMRIGSICWQQLQTPNHPIHLIPLIWIRDFVSLTSKNKVVYWYPKCIYIYITIIVYFLGM